MGVGDNLKLKYSELRKLNNQPESNLYVDSILKESELLREHID